MSRLSIVIPHRDREEHRDVFLPHTVNYLTQEHIPAITDFEITIVEQAGDDLFNKGMLSNIGHVLTRDHCGYVCIHDIDYLPVKADYSYPERPARVIWHGIESRPIVPGGPHVIRHDRSRFFGGVVTFSRKHFELVDGFSNRYWGWGFEDGDLRERFLAAGLTIDFRDGTFHALSHVNDCFRKNGTLNARGRRNQQLFGQQQEARAGNCRIQDGISTLDFEIECHTQCPVSSNGLLKDVSVFRVRLPERSEED